MGNMRKHTSKRSERLLSVYANGHSVEPSDTTEFEEEDIWSIGYWEEANHPSSSESYSSSNSNASFSSERQKGGLSLAFEGAVEIHPQPTRHVATSAPVNVPDWSRICHVSSEYFNGSEEEAEMVPPHVYLAREYARKKKVGGASVFEGMGRTLKGRDMRRMRDAVWRQTGFDG